MTVGNGQCENGGEFVGTSALIYKSKCSYDRFGNRFRKAAENTTGSPTTNWVEDNQIDPATNRFANSTSSTFDSGKLTAQISGPITSRLFCWLRCKNRLQTKLCRSLAER